LALAGALLLGSCSNDPGEKETTDALKKPEVMRSLMDAAATAQAQNDPATASNYYRSVYTRDAKRVDAAVGLMQSLRAIGGLDEAREVAKKALIAAPEDPALLAEVGKVDLVTGQLQDAVDLLQRASNMNALDWKSRSALGLAYDRLGDFAHADEAYEAALKISPENPAVLNNYGLSRAMARDVPGARDLLERAVKAGGADIRMRQNLAIIYALSGDMARAEAIARRDLPPSLASQTVDFYHELAAAPAQQEPQ
jgi:Flp pilus assembly protein TadD